MPKIVLEEDVSLEKRLEDIVDSQDLIMEALTLILMCSNWEEDVRDDIWKVIGKLGKRRFNMVSQRLAEEKEQVEKEIQKEIKKRKKVSQA
jgi:hypothetical protein